MAVEAARCGRAGVAVDEVASLAGAVEAVVACWWVGSAHVGD
ncbi:hypothetical protein [Actinosynnema sp. ALI-1.44]|nr:hypothetical protein [Actinosynnema sp. ALI-1.44]